MTAAEMVRLIGRKALLRLDTNDKVQIEVTIIDVKERWGVLCYQICPVAGFGTVWVVRLNFVNIRS